MARGEFANLPLKEQLLARMIAAEVAAILPGAIAEGVALARCAENGCDPDHHRAGCPRA